MTDLQVCNIIKNRLQHMRFPVNIAKFLRTSILKNIWERLLLPLEVLCKDFVDISNGNASFRILQDSIWLQVIYFLTTIAFWCVKYHFRIDGDNLRVLAKDSAIMENSLHYINYFRLFYNWRIKSSKNFARNHAVPGLFFQNCPGFEVDFLTANQKQETS